MCCFPSASFGVVDSKEEEIKTKNLFVSICVMSLQCWEQHFH